MINDKIPFCFLKELRNEFIYDAQNCVYKLKFIVDNKKIELLRMKLI